MICPKCKSQDVQVQTFQEQKGSKTVTKFHFKATEKKHGCLWWVFIGWWWWIVDFTLWLCLFPFMFIYHLFYRRKKYEGSGKSVSQTRNKITYKTVCVCQSCGKRWTK